MNLGPNGRVRAAIAGAVITIAFGTAAPASAHEPNLSPTCNPVPPLTTTFGTTGFVATCADPDAGDTLSYEIGTQPTQGVVLPPTPTLPFPGFTYTANPGATGTDTFTFRAVDNHQAPSEDVTVAVNIAPQAALPPTCLPPAPLSLRPGTSRPVVLSCFVIGGGAVTFEITEQPDHGELSPTVGPFGPIPGGYTYTADSGITTPTPDSFKFTATANGQTSAEQTQAITISPDANAEPFCLAVLNPMRLGAARTISITCTDADGDPVTLSDPSASAGTLQLDTLTQPSGATPGSIVYTAPESMPLTGPSVTLSISADDGRGLVGPTQYQAPFTLVPADQDTAPDCFVPPDFVIPVEYQSSLLLPSAPCSDAEGDAFEVVVTDPPDKGTLSAPDASGLRTYTAGPGQTGPDSFKFKAVALTGDEPRLESDEETVLISIGEAPPNSPPVCDDQSVDVDHETAKQIALGCTDVDGDALTYEIVGGQGPSKGTLGAVGSDGEVTYTPGDGETGADSFKFKAKDPDNAESAEKTVSITIADEPNTAPVCQDKSVDVDHNTAEAFTVTCTDGNGDPLSITQVAAPTKGTIGAIAANGGVTYTPTAGQSGTDTFTFKANDGEADSNTATATMTIAGPPNQKPVCEAQSATVPEGEATTIDLACTDGDGDPLTLSATTPGHGTLGTIDDVNDDVDYTPTAGYFGADTFTYRGFDGSDFSDASTVTITVVRSIVDQVVAPGGTVTTGTGASEDAPVITGVTLPAGTGGTVTIVETPVVDDAPSGFSFIGQQVDITAPDAPGPEEPLRLVFEVAASALPAGTTAANLAVFRNGTAVPACTGADDHAVPNPCVDERETLGNGNVRITVLTVEASRWNFGRANPTSNPDPDPDPDDGQQTPRDDQQGQGQNGQGQQQGGGGAGGGGGGGATTPADTRAPVGSFAVAARQTIRTLIRKGLRVTVRCDEACTTRVELRIDRKTAKRLKLKTTLARANARLTAGGSKKVAVKLPAKTKKKLKTLRSMKITVRTTAVDGAGNSARPKSRTVKLKR